MHANRDPALNNATTYEFGDSLIKAGNRYLRLSAILVAHHGILPQHPDDRHG